MDSEKLLHGTLRWYVDSKAWQPSSNEYAFLLGLFNEDEQNAIKRFYQEDDRKRALISRLLQRGCVRLVCGVPDEDIQIMKTRGKKPFTTNRKPDDVPNFNFNVSHEGNYTALASEPFCVCGVDVAAPQQLRRSGNTHISVAIQNFKDQFAASEWSLIQSFAHDERRMEACFQQLWSLKEAYVKARGDGLGFEPLSRAEFTFQEGDDKSRFAQLTLDGIRQPKWSFELQSLPGGHWVSVARGPPDDIIDAFGVFKSTFGKYHLTDEEMKVYLAAHSPLFKELHVKDLLSPQQLAAYMDILNQGI